MIDLVLSLRHWSKPWDDSKQCLIIKSAPDSRAHLFQIKGITKIFTGLLTNMVFLWRCPGQIHLSARSLSSDMGSCGQSISVFQVCFLFILTGCRTEKQIKIIKMQAFLVVLNVLGAEFFNLED